MTEKKLQPGRPPNSGLGLTKPITIRFDPKHWHRLATTARKEGKTGAQKVRELVAQEVAQ